MLKGKSIEFRVGHLNFTPTSASHPLFEPRQIPYHAGIRVVTVKYLDSQPHS